MAKLASVPTRTLRLLAIVAGLLVLAAIAFALWSWLRPKTDGLDHFTGYVVSDNLYMASPIAGTLTEVAVKRGRKVAAGDVLFRVDPVVRAAEADQARAVISASLAQVRQHEATIAGARADLAASETEAARASSEASRLRAAQRERAGAVAQLDIDKADAAYRSAISRRDAARGQLASTQASLAAARAQVEQAQAGLASAEHQLNDLAPVAPRSGRIDDIMFKAGESVPANSPVVSIVPDDEVKVRFFVPQSQVNAFQPGRSVAIACDGCPAGMTAVVDFVDTRPQYTPPIIYSLDARQKLVFMVEAVPANGRELVPGQPMDVTGAGPARSSR